MAEMGTKPTNMVTHSVFAAAPEYLRPPAGSHPQYVEKWNEMVMDFPDGYFKPSDRPVMEAYVFQATLVARASEQLTQESLLELDGTGKRVPNPLLKILNEATKVLATLSGKLRTAPSGRLHNSSVPRESEIVSTQTIRGSSQVQGTHPNKSGTVTGPRLRLA